jgi:serine/threonine protein phosphatase 1
MRNMFGRAPAWSVPQGERVYAVGDIHGRLDCLEALLPLIEADDSSRGPADTTFVFLGDLVDRGPDSSGVVQRLLEFSRGPRRTRFLLGNHEEVFLRALTGDSKATRYFARIGGRETILSYGFEEAEYQGLDYDEVTRLLLERVPQEHVEFLKSFEDQIEIGDYLFVHAGIRPDVPLDEQTRGDLRWIREDFLNHRQSFGKMVVHGHTITEEVEVRSNRIGIDTGAFSTGRLTAIGLEGTERWFLST